MHLSATDEEAKEAGQDLLDNMLDYMLEKVMPLGSRVVRGLSYL